MKNKTLVKVVALSALLVLVGLLAGCLMDVPPSSLEGKWGTAVLGTTVLVYEFKEGAIYTLGGLKVSDAKYSLNSITTFKSNGEEKGTAKYSRKGDKLTIESNEAGLTAGTYIKM